MNVETVAGVLLIVAPLWFNVTFALLGKRFEYPDILRRPAEDILDRFRAGGSSLILLWWTFMLSGLILIAAIVLLGQSLGFWGIVPLGRDHRGPGGARPDARTVAMGLPRSVTCSHARVTLR